MSNVSAEWWRLESERPTSQRSRERGGPRDSGAAFVGGALTSELGGRGRSVGGGRVIGGAGRPAGSRRRSCRPCRARSQRGRSPAALLRHRRAAVRRWSPACTPARGAKTGPAPAPPTLRIKIMYKLYECPIYRLRRPVQSEPDRPCPNKNKRRKEGGSSEGGDLEGFVGLRRRPGAAGEGAGWSWVSRLGRLVSAVRRRCGRPWFRRRGRGSPGAASLPW